MFSTLLINDTAESRGNVVINPQLVKTFVK